MNDKTAYRLQNMANKYADKASTFNICYEF